MVTMVISDLKLISRFKIFRETGPGVKRRVQGGGIHLKILLNDVCGAINLYEYILYS